MRKRSLVALLLLPLSAAKAQDIPIFDWSGVIQSMAIGDAIIQAAQQSPAGVAPAQAKTTAMAERLTFKPSSAGRRANLMRFAAQFDATDPAQAANLRQLTDQNFAAIERELKVYGLNPYNLADMYTLYWVNAWDAANQVFTTNTKGQMQAVKAQLTPALVQSSKLLEASDAAKQELSEAILLQALMLSASNEAYKDNPKVRAMLASAAQQGAATLGLDVMHVNLTPGGFVKR